eukprot:6195118-Pleurochrysis_carterae.AAC.2
MKRTVEKCKKLINNKHNNEGVIQAERALQAIDRHNKHINSKIKEEEELALRQMISGIIREWQEADNKEKKGTIAAMRMWTGGMMNWARIHMKTWTEKKNVNEAKVQRRWGNRGKCIQSSRNGKKYHQKRRSRTRGEKRNGGKRGRQREDIWNETLGQGQVDIKNTRTG